MIYIDNTANESELPPDYSDEYEAIEACVEMCRDDGWMLQDVFGSSAYSVTSDEDKNGRPVMVVRLAEVGASISTEMHLDGAVVQVLFEYDATRQRVT